MSYLSLSKELLKEKIEQALLVLESCHLCALKCGAKRLNNIKGLCRSGRNAIISGYGSHYGEEKILVGKNGSGTIFFSNCNLNCVFCQNYDISHFGEGTEVTAEKLGKIMIRLQNAGCHNINLVSPTHFVPQILEALLTAVKLGLKVPLVYNSGGYDNVDILKILDGVVKIYMPDIKFGEDSPGKVYLGVKNYFTTAKQAIKEMHRQVGDLVLDQRGLALEGLLVRHLVLPNNLAQSDAVLSFLAEEISLNTYINIMDQYYPAHQAFTYEELNRRITQKEYKKVLSLAAKLGFKNIIGYI